MLKTSFNQGKMTAGSNNNHEFIYLAKRTQLLAHCALVQGDISQY
jgi:hypothetical protein